MRKVSQSIAAALKAGVRKSSGSTATNGKSLFLHGNEIARIQSGRLEISWAGWPTLTTAERINAALGAMASNEIAFKAYEYADGTAGLSILADYVVISRAKKSAPWKDAGTRILASCQWDADEQVTPTPLRKAVTPETWIDLQTRQHLRAVGIKLTR